MLPRSATLAVALAVVVVAGASVFSITGVSTAPHGTPGQERRVPPTWTSDATPVPAGARATPLPSSTPIPITVSLTESNSSSLQSFLASAENPKSPDYRHYLTYSQFVGRFAPSPASADRVASVLLRAGAQSLAVYPDRSAISAVLPAGAVNALFGVRMVEFGSPGSGSRFTAEGTASVPTSLRGLISGVSGLSNVGSSPLEQSLHAVGGLHAVRAGAGPTEFVNYTTAHSQWFVGSDFTQEFGATTLFPGSGSVEGAVFPTDVAIATLLAGGYNDTLAVNLPAYDPTVVQAYFNGTFPSSWPKPNVTGVPVSIDGLTPPPPASFGTVNDSTADEFENSLDLEMAGSLAPGASVVNFYFAGSLVAGPASAGAIANYFAASLSEALAHNYSPARLAVVSASFGLPDLNDSEWNFETSAAAAMGVTIVVASGDQGNAPNSLSGRDTGPWPTWPATADTNSSGAVAVGGVSLTLGGRPTSVYDGNGSLNLTYDSNLTGITNLTAWFDTSNGVAGTEGGVSTVYSEPYWQWHSAAQPAIRNATIVQGASSIGRAEPDLAMPANNTIATVWANGTEAVYFTVLEGTSVAAPVFAGELADIVAVESARSANGWSPLGFFDPTIYRIASFYAANPSAADPFSAVTSGENFVFAAAPGWDPLTGWGTVNASRLLAADENSTVSGYEYAGPTPGLPPTGSGSPSPYNYVELFLILGAGVVVALVVVVLATRRRPPPPSPATIPFGAFNGGPPPPPGTGGPSSGATFLCPYCGTPRPAEPVRCPRCGAY